ncbi:MAG TPA: pitrilysin family protein [Terriglobales bacterium]|nr:pitrilysin family protein [Terriglobales bacterium]
MKKRTQSSFVQVLFCFVLLFTSFSPAQVKPWNQIQAPPLPAFKPQQPLRVQLPNGMVIFLQEDHELPLIDASARIRGGSVNAPANKAGMLGLYGEVWRTGGTKTKTGDQMDDFLEARAAKIETEDDAESTSISLNCLKGDFDAVFDMFLDLLHNPEFRTDKLELAKDQMYTEISRRNDDVESIVHRESRIIAYGKDNAYARVPEYATVASVSRDDLLNWHQQYAYPNNIIFGITGDFDSKAMQAKLEQAFGSWQKGPGAQQPDVKFTEPKPGLYLIGKSDVNQSTIAMLDLGIERSNPDYFAVSVMNEIFGGGFSSRLFNNIRSKLGLAYAVGGGVGFGWDRPGLTNIEMQTKSATTVDGIQALNNEIDDLQKNAATPEELKRAKDNILNSFIFQFDTPEKVLREKMSYEFYHYPFDFLERYRTEVEKVTADDVTRVARKYVHKDRMAVLVLGNGAEFGKPLSTLGPVQNVDIAIPPPPASLMQQGPGGE